jgi:hypothetical protein
MTHDEALVRCQELNSEETGDRHWLPKRLESGDWDVVAISGTGMRPQGPLKESAVARARPSDAPDPRPSIFRNIPPYGAG